MNVMSLFATPASAVPTSGAGAPAPAPNSSAAIAAANPTVPSTANTPIQTDPLTGKPMESPLANFADLWKTDPNAKTNEPFRFNSDPAKLLESSRGIDFTKVIPPDLQLRMNAGGSDGVKAQQEAMNLVAQMTFAQSANASAKIGETVAMEVERRVQALLPQLIRQHAVSDSIRAENPLLNNPATAPMVEALQQQLTSKYPNASSQEIKQHINDYLNGVVDIVKSGQPTPEVKKTGREEMDWSKFLQ
jgi:hypothetical protein